MLQPQINSARLAPMEMMQRVGVIHLTNGGFTIVDPERVGELNVRRWHTDRDGYVRSGVRVGKKTTPLRLHRLVMNAERGMEVDHKNRDLLDNRISNLRIATKSQNAANSKKPAKRGVTSKYKGVSWDKGAWSVSVCTHYLGRFQSETEAARVYNAAALERFGEFARLNEIP